MKNLFFICLIGILSLFCVNVCFADNPNLQDDLIITIKPTKPTGGTRPRSIGDSDVVAYYSAGAIFFTFNVDLDSVYIEIMNLTNGDTWSSMQNDPNTSVVSISDEPGRYVINIYTECNDYVGRFELN
ncbi:MAG: DUF3244 domain-containing protein [Alistipes sp.]|nr:DUF3244 domain-containing protein [Alistipes sp.]